MVSSVLTSLLVTYTGHYVRSVCLTHGFDQITDISLDPIRFTWAIDRRYWYRVSNNHRLVHTDCSVGHIHGSCWVWDWYGRKYALHCDPGCNGEASGIHKFTS